MPNIYSPDLLTASEVVQGLVSIYTGFLANGGNPGAIDTFVDNMCKPSSGSDEDRAWCEFIVLHHDVMRLVQGSDNCLCLELFDPCNKLSGDAERLGLNVLADLFAGLAFYVAISHPECIAAKQSYSSANEPAYDRRLVHDMTDISNVAIAGMAWRELRKNNKG